MATKARTTIGKRRREEARKERQRQKAARREQREAERQVRPRGATGEDPDIAGIVPGPQPLPWDGGEESGEESGEK